MKAKYIIALLLFTIVSKLTFAQTDNFTSQPKVYKSELPVINITKDVNLLVRSPEPVQFVDLSTNRMIGDLPAENVVRIKIAQKETRKEVVNDSIVQQRDLDIEYVPNQEIGVITIVGQSFMAQYRVIYQEEQFSANVLTNIEIAPNDMQPLEYPQYEFSTIEFRNHAMQMITKKANKPIRKTSELKLISQLNNVYTLGDYVFLDVTFTNKTNLVYDIDQLTFSIDDKKIYKSTNVQSIDVSPVYQLYNNKKFRKSYRNIYVFKKFTYPNNKVLNVRLTENQISGRTINLEIKYSDILDADTF